VCGRYEQVVRTRAERPDTMIGRRNCFLSGHGNCGGKISGEHYISKTLLEAISADGTVQIGGLPWQPQQTLQKIGIGSLVSNVLCETHNSGLSSLDDVAGKVFRAVDAADKRPASLPAITRVAGPLIERWFLKVICGMAAAVGFNNGTVPAAWGQLLTGGQWPEGSIPSGSQILATEFYVETLVAPNTREVRAAKFRVAGVHFTLLLGRPDTPAAWGNHRPRRLIFQDGIREKRVELMWPFKTEQAVIYTKVGVGSTGAPQWDGWKE
jgi:hypothetical protein